MMRAPKLSGKVLAKTDRRSIAVDPSLLNKWSVEHLLFCIREVDYKPFEKLLLLLRERIHGLDAAFFNHVVRRVDQQYGE